MAQERHGDFPVSTRWAAFSLGREARAESGLASTRLAVLFLTPDTGWYTYAADPGPLGKPTRLAASLDGGATRLAAYYPPGTPQPSALDPSDPSGPAAVMHEYLGRTPLFVPLPASPAANQDGPLALTAELELLLCTKDKCLPAKFDLAFRVPATALPEARDQAWWPLLLQALKTAPAQPEAPADSIIGPAAQDAAWAGLRPRYHQPGLEVGGLAKAVLLGLLAGFVLNFMPCALPVISIKLSSLLAGSGAVLEAERRAKIREHFLFLALGALLYFLFLGLLFGLTDLAWGQIFQQPSVVLSLTLVVFALSLSLLGVFTLPIIDLKFDQMTTHPKLQSLFTGMLTTLLATPCSGPFLGGVLGWALLQPPLVVSTVLLSIGLGMAAPYLLICAFPVLARFCPKPGPWTAVVERLVALFLMGTCIYLLNILPHSMLIPALILLLVTSVSCWIWGCAGPGFDTRRALALKFLAVALIAACAFWVMQPRPKSEWERFTPQAVTTLLGRQTVVVDFTADWCPSCKVLEQTTLSPGRMADLKTRHGLALVKADLTERSPEAESLLNALGSKSIPVLAIFPKNAPDEPLVLRDLFTPAQLEDALQQTQGN